MNRIYNLVWSAARGALVVASEFAKSQGKQSGARQPRKRHSRVRIRLFFTGLLLIPVSAFALPTGGKVVAGQATIHAGGKDMVVNQSSDRAIIDWKSFNIGANESVRFNQNGANAAVLNRVYDQSASTIAGKLSANGQVFIANPNGVIFSKGSQVSVGGLVATTKAVDPDQFMAGGKVTLSGDSKAAIINGGDIKAGEGGYVALVAARVSNTGSIEASKGAVAMTAGDMVDLTFDNGSLVDLKVSKGALDAEVKNGGVIRTPGGRVMLTAKAANNLTSAVVNNTGVVEAKTLGDLTGHIELIADMDVGTAEVGGMLDASALDGGNGGFIETSGAHVKVADNAKITTKSTTGKSGTWLIDPVDFKIAPDFGDMTGKQLSDQLKNGNVVIQSTQGVTPGLGDIQVYDNVTWDHNTLTLDAVNSISVKAALTAGGDAGLAFKYANELIVAPGTGRVDFTGTGNTITFNGHAATIVRNTDQLQAMRSNLGGWYVLGADIDASVTKTWNGGKGFVGIRGFGGLFDGLGHTINSLYMNDTSRKGSTSYGTGLFDTTTAASFIRNVGVTNADITAHLSYGGILVGDNQGDISYSFTTGRIYGTYGNCFGGLAGHDTGGQIFNSFSSADVAGPSWIGGLVGHVTGSASFYQSYATGTVTGTGPNSSYGLINIGGLVGGLDTTATVAVRDSYSTVRISAPGYSYVGGLIGHNISGRQIVNSYWDKEVTGIATSSGGTGLTSAQMRNPASFAGWDIDTTGGQNTTWRMYAGKDAPMLKAFMKPVEAYMTDATFTYNGKSQAVDLLQWSGVNVDTSRLHYSTNAGEVTAKDVGEYDIYSYNFYSDPFGYDISFRGPLQSKITITPADLKVKANDGRKTYDGKAYTGANGVTYIGLVGGETAAVLGGTLTFDNGYQGAVNAGSYILNASGLTSKNYNITYLPGTLTIDKAALTVKAGDAAKTYDGKQFVGGPGVTYSGFVNGEGAGVLGGSLQWSGNAQGAVNAGTYDILAAGLTSGNYAITYLPGKLTVGKASLVVGADNVTKTYDGTTKASGHATVVGGQLFGDDSISGGNFAFTDANAGTGKTVTVDNVAIDDGNGGGNYEVTYQVNTSSTINKAQLTVTPNDDSKTYDGRAYSGNKGVTYSGFVNGETAAVLDGLLSFAGSSQGAINAGDYAITASGLTGQNYDIAYQDGSLHVGKASLVLGSSDVTKTYDGTTKASGHATVVGGQLFGDDSIAGGDFAFTDRNAGTGKTVTVSGVAVNDGNGGGNYDVSYQANTSSTIDKASLVLGSSDVTKVYDGTLSADGHAVVLGGQLFGNDRISGGDFAFTDANAGTAKTVTVGNVAIDDGNGGQNYDVSYQANTNSIIDKASLTVTANDDSKNRDGHPYRGGNGVIYTGFVPGDDAGDLQGSIQWGGDSQGATAGGDYSLLPGGLSSDNYDISYQAGTLTISQYIPYDENGGKNNDPQKPVTPGDNGSGHGGDSGNSGDVSPNVPDDGGTKIDDGSQAGDIGDVGGGHDGTTAPTDPGQGGNAGDDGGSSSNPGAGGDSTPGSGDGSGDNGGNSGNGSAHDGQDDSGTTAGGSETSTTTDSSAESGACSGASATDSDKAVDRDCLIPAKARAHRVTVSKS